MSSPRIYLSPPHLGGDEWTLAKEAFDSNWVAPLGPHVDAFEKEICALTGSAAACALSSGTAALHLAMRLLGVGRDDEVLVPTLTFIATANPVVYEGGRPFFIDSERTSWNMDPDVVAEILADRAKTGKLPKAVIAVDLFGQCADYDRLNAVCSAYEVPLVSDAAESLGATYKGKAAGTTAKLGVFSFNGNKIITTSGGGMLIGEDPDLISKARFWATQARDPAPHYQHSELGFNYRMSNVLAGVGRGQLRVLSQRVSSRRANFEFYVKTLGDLPGVTFMPEAAWGKSNRWLTCLQINPELSGGVAREHVYDALNGHNIESRPIWKPLHLQPIFAGAGYRGRGVSEELFTRGLCLPSGSSLTPSELERIAGLVRQCFRK